MSWILQDMYKAVESAGQAEGRCDLIREGKYIRSARLESSKRDMVRFESERLGKIIFLGS